MYHIYPKWLRWLPFPILFRILRKRYSSLIWYEDADGDFNLSMGSRFENERSMRERIDYLEKVVSENADVIIQKICKESQ